ncbi:MAG: EAL domain-containing protein [Thiothrix sp.]|nr:EAL domain-containing protein [Thiothrix sp.]HPQ96119.1 EAL domain-containing protein [Thiolinea sp.]
MPCRYSDEVRKLKARIKKLAQARNRLQTIMESLQEVVWMYAPGARRLLYVSPAYEAIWQRPRQALYRNPHDFTLGIHPEDRQQVLETLQKHDEAGHWDLLYRVVRPDGSTLWVNDQGKGIYDRHGRLKFMVGRAIDITDTMELTARLTYSEALFHSVFEFAAIGIAIVDTQGKVLNTNSFFCEFLGYTPEEMRSIHFRDITHPDDIQRDLELFEQVLNGRMRYYHLEKRYLTRDDRIVWGHLSVSFIPPSNTRQGLSIAVVQDITEEKRAEGVIFEQANFDPLTHLPNRHFFQQHLEERLGNFSREHQTCYLLLLDLDNFKEINDSSGHSAGDYILQTIARRLTRSVMPRDMLARLGGDEFAILVISPASLSAIESLCRRILETVVQNLRYGDNTYRISASIGISRAPDDGLEAGLLIQHADTAMYETKKQGGNNFHFFSPRMNQMVKHRLQIKSELHQALENGELELCFQPIFHNQVHRFTKAEALIRWNHPVRGLIMPDEFIPVAEESDLIRQVDLFVLKQAMRFLQQHLTDLPAGFSLAINISAPGLASANFRQMLNTCSGLVPYLDIEITERVYLKGDQATRESLDLVIRLGGRICIDDFGTGYSNLAQLQNQAADRIKIDKSFLQNLDPAHPEKALINSLIPLVQAMGADVVVEGIETATQHDYLRRFPSAYLQGYHIAPTMPETAFLRFMQHQKE